MAHDQEVVGSNPGTVYWMDVSDAGHYINPKITKIKVAKWGTPKKYLKNTLNHALKTVYYDIKSITVIENC
jgi:hypothetical protein